MRRFAIVIAFAGSPLFAETCPSSADAYKAATDYVMFQLKSPFSAEFPALGAEYTASDRQEGCSFLVNGYVDARNSLGRTVRQGFSVTVEYDLEADSWSATDLKTTG